MAFCLFMYPDYRYPWKPANPLQQYPFFGLVVNDEVKNTKTVKIEAEN